MSDLELRSDPDGSEPPKSKREQLAMALKARHDYARGKPRPSAAEVREKNRIAALRYSRSAKGKRKRAENYQKNKDRINEKRRTERVHDADADLRHKLKSRYGITRQQYVEMKDRQGGVCAVCGQANASGRRLCVDHCHATGAVRGLLCDKCNVGLANYRDNPSLLRAAADYLEARNG